ncbi:MAG: 4-oxalocrotonate decarboxylase [Phenylobacterium zucineum]|nr:MAG: 4-oxalocrotonate decarboxylase [Phenylobacterium zucineum]
MPTPAIRDQIVDELFDAYATHTPIKPLKPRLPDIDVAAAYEIQREFVRRKLAQGRKIVGYKVGLTSKAMQDFAGSTEPDFSVLTDDLLLPEGTPIAHGALFRPLVELEIAFVMKAPLQGPGVTVVDVLRATDFVLPAIEMVDMRVERGPGMSLVDNIADLAYCGAAILGGTPRRLDQIDIRAVSGALSVNGELKHEGVASAVMGNPVTVVAWLANKLSEFDVTFEAGQVILTGSFVPAVPVSAGDDVLCRFDQGLGDVAVSFT